MKRALALLEQQKAKRGLPLDEDQKDLPSFPLKPTRLPSANRISQEKEKTKLTSDLNPKSIKRKNSNHYPSSRISSSGHEQERPTKNTVEFLSLKEPRPPYQLSLQQKMKKPPHKLKPLPGGGSKVKVNEESEWTYQFSKSEMKELDSEINQYMDSNQIPSIVKEMEAAFTGKPPSSSHTLTLMTSKPTSLYSIPEAEELTQDLVLYNPTQTMVEQRAKKNEFLKKQVKMLTNGESQGQGNDKDMFITSCPVKDGGNSEKKNVVDEGRTEEENESTQKKKKYYKYEEDKLLDEVEQHERDMNEMLKYLQEVESLIKGNDLTKIQESLDATKAELDEHYKTQNKIKESISSISTKADDTIQSLSFYIQKKDQKQEQQIVKS